MRNFTPFQSAIILVGFLLVVSFPLEKLLAVNLPLTPRNVPARTIPVPMDVSPELQQQIEQPLNPLASLIPKTPQEWLDLTNKFKTNFTAQMVATAKKLFPVDVKAESMYGIPTFTVSPKTVPQKNKERVLICIHGGGFVFNGGEGCLPDAMAMAHYGQIKVIAVDYRLLPGFPFPAALEDTVAVYQKVLKTYKPQNIGIYGTSAGGGLTAAALLKIRELGLPLPAVVGLGTPFVELAKTGDTLFTNEDIDNVLVSYNGFLEETVRLYIGSFNLLDPFISPIYGDFSKGFPPTILTSGTRDLFLSSTVRLHRKLREAKVEAYLQVFEGCSHAFYVQLQDSPESKEAYQEMVLFFDKHLGQIDESLIQKPKENVQSY